MMSWKWSFWYGKSRLATGRVLPIMVFMLIAMSTTVLPANMLLSKNINSGSQWIQLTPLPENLGLAGVYAGVSQASLLVAGGANFPGKMPWEGGKKVWYDTIYMLDHPDGQWKMAGRLPRALGYGVSVSYKDAVICVGGSDALRHHPDCFRLRINNEKCVVEPLPSLPIPLALMSGALVSNVLYIAGGCEVPGESLAVNSFFGLDLESSNLTWQPLDPIPGEGRLLACAAGYDDAFYLFGGAALRTNAQGKVSRVYLREALSYRKKTGWTRLPEMPKPCVAAPSPVPRIHGCFWLLSGDDGSLIDFKPLDKHPGFPNTVLKFDPTSNRWSRAGEIPAPRATTSCVGWNSMYVVPSGEVRPGVRSPEIWGYNLDR